MGELGPVGMILLGFLTIFVASGLLNGTPAEIAQPILAAGLIVYALKMTEFDPSYMASKVTLDSKKFFSTASFWLILFGCVIVGLSIILGYSTITLPVEKNTLVYAGTVAAGTGAVLSLVRLGKKEG